jgi:hypothetical protein
LICIIKLPKAFLVWEDLILGFLVIMLVWVRPLPLRNIKVNKVWSVDFMHPSKPLSFNFWDIFLI